MKMQPKNRPPLLMIEGNIGAGKSTFLGIIQKHLNAEVIFEPTNKWQDKNEEDNLLLLFYKDTRRWAYTFQSFAFISRINTILEHQEKNTSNKVQFLERSVYCDRYCFAKNCYESGLMSKVEWKIYKEWFSWLAEKHAPQPSGFIYLRAEPQKCLQRIAKRSRHEESSISIDYLRELHRRHEEWLIEKRDITPHLNHIPVLVLDCNEEFETNETVQKAHLRAVENFINQEILPFGCKKEHKSVNYSL